MPHLEHTPSQAVPFAPQVTQRGNTAGGLVLVPEIVRAHCTLCRRIQHGKEKRKPESVVDEEVAHK